MNSSPEVTKLLFVCSRNQWRSPTAERIVAGLPGYAARSAGTARSARIKVTECHVRWADMIFAMEKSHADRIREQFREVLSEKPLICLHIPDDFEFMDAALVELLKARLGEHLDLPG